MSECDEGVGEDCASVSCDELKVLASDPGDLECISKADLRNFSRAGFADRRRPMPNHLDGSVQQEGPQNREELRIGDMG